MALDDCNLRDIKPKGNLFTWHSTRNGIHIQTWARLDCFLHNSSFDNLFNVSGVYHLDWIFSNHRPIEVRLDSNNRRTDGRAKKLFKFEEIWTRYDTCVGLIKANGDWKSCSSFSLKNSLNSCSKVLSKWGNEIDVNRKKRIVECKKALRDAYENVHNVNFEMIHELEFELDNLLEEDEIYWKQRSREE